MTVHLVFSHTIDIFCVFLQPSSTVWWKESATKDPVIKVLVALPAGLSKKLTIILTEMGGRSAIETSETI